MKKYGYIINQGKPQLLLNQLQDLLSYDCDELFVEPDELISEPGSEFRKMLDLLNEGDLVIISNFKIFADNKSRWRWFSQQLEKKSVTLYILQGSLTKECRKAMASDLIVKTMSRKNKKTIRDLDNDEKVLGRPKITQEQIDEILNYRINKHLTYREISSLTQLSLGTVYKYTKKYGKIFSK